MEINWRRKRKPLTDPAFHIFFWKTPLINYVWIMFSHIYSIFCGFGLVLDSCWFMLTRVDSCRTRVDLSWLMSDSCQTRVDSCWLVPDSCRFVSDSCWFVSDSCWLVSDSWWFVLTRVDLCWYLCIRIDLILILLCLPKNKLLIYQQQNHSRESNIFHLKFFLSFESLCAEKT